MNWVKSQITSPKLQINLKFQKSNPKQKRKSMNQVYPVVCDSFMRPAFYNYPFGLSWCRRLSAGPYLFGSLELGIWLLFVICCLVLVISLFSTTFLNNGSIF
jgi:hypothetical protein